MSKVAAKKKFKTNINPEVIESTESTEVIPINLVSYDADLIPYSVSELLSLNGKNLVFPQMKSDEYLDDLDKIKIVIKYYTLLQSNIQTVIRRTTIAVNFAISEQNEIRVDELSNKLNILNAWDTKCFALLTLLDNSVSELTGVVKLVKTIESSPPVFDMEKINSDSPDVIDISSMHDDNAKRILQLAPTSGIDIFVLLL